MVVKIWLFIIAAVLVSTAVSSKQVFGTGKSYLYNHLSGGI